MTQPDVGSLGVDPAEIISGVERLHASWGLRYATIRSVTSDFSAVGIYHGDSVNEVPFISLVGPLFPEQRVAALFIPPSGNYVISVLSGFTPTKLIDFVETNVAATDTIGGAETDLSRLALPNISVAAGQLYRLDLQVITNRTVAANEFEFVLRADTAVTGTVMGSAYIWGTSTTAGQYAQASIYWEATTTGELDLFISVIRQLGAGTLTVFYQNFGQLTRTFAALYSVGNATLRRVITS